MIPLWLLWVSASIAAGALAMTVANLRLFRPAPRATALPPGPTLAVCVPARDEAANIEACLRSVLRPGHAGVRAFVYDDQSTDATPEILARLKGEFTALSTVPSRPLPPGWVGKQWACWQLGQAAAAAAEHDWLLFIDADVRLAPDALPRALAAAADLRADLVSTFPRQLTGALAERLLVPLIHFILLSYLPFARMRSSPDPSASAACGQFILVRREAYLATGGHSAYRDSMHEGVKMPRVFRRAGFRTDLFDGTDLCTCRMYRGLAQTWRGFAKNAYEGLGSVPLLLFLTALHLVGHVLPAVALALLAARGEVVSMPGLVAALALAIVLAQRLLLARRFRQSLIGALLHPVGVAMMTLVQWHSFLLALTGRRAWRGRTLAESGPAAPTAAAPQPATPA
jgi:hypothetical protein